MIFSAALESTAVFYLSACKFYQDVLYLDIGISSLYDEYMAPAFDKYYVFD